MKKQRTLPAIAAIAALTLALTACGATNNSAQPSAEPTATASPVPTEESTSTPVPTESTSTTAPTENPSTPAPKPTANSEAKVIKGTGVYVGQIDSHSVEIETKEGPTAFEITAGMESILEKLNTDDSVVFEYVEKAVEGDATVKQRVLSKLSLAK
ncbi:hypothetical protein ACDZ28_17905 [Paenibacillus sp. RS8]|uniref:hypothetical protein n=1 Tax=Paenibacillus sp. RS8 TaxID=3242681 RepID=UPI0035BFD10E